MTIGPNAIWKFKDEESGVGPHTFCFVSTLSLWVPQNQSYALEFGHQSSRELPKFYSFFFFYYENCQILKVM